MGGGRRESGREGGEGLRGGWELQHTATHYNTLQHAAKHYTQLQHTATRCNTLQHTATHCNTLQHTATHYNTLQSLSRARERLNFGYRNTPYHTATRCNTLQHTATLCNILQHTATYCNTLHNVHQRMRSFSRCVRATGGDGFQSLSAPTAQISPSPMSTPEE